MAGGRRQEAGRGTRDAGEGEQRRASISLSVREFDGSRRRRRQYHRRMDLDEWIAAAPRALCSEAVWKVRAFQINAYIAWVASRDALLAQRDARFIHVAPQLVRAAGSIAANIAEGYSRQSRRDRIKYYEYALGSANEAKSWYTTAADVFDAAVVEDRLTYLSRASQLLLRMIQNESRGIALNVTKRLV